MLNDGLGHTVVFRVRAFKVSDENDDFVGRAAPGILPSTKTGKGENWNDNDAGEGETACFGVDRFLDDVRLAIHLNCAGFKLFLLEVDVK